MTQAGELGQVFLVATERIGPFPDRVRDVGVDQGPRDPRPRPRALAGRRARGAAWQPRPSTAWAASTRTSCSPPGGSRTTISFNCVVDWLSPTKVRQTRVLGERGMLVADTLTADLTFYENGDVASEWADTQSLRGVSEGDATRYALARREPLLVELEAFCDLLAGDADAPVVTLAEGLETVLVAEAVLASARDGETVAVEVVM